MIDLWHNHFVWSLEVKIWDPVSQLISALLLLNFFASYLVSWWTCRALWRTEFFKVYVQFLLHPMLLLVGAACGTLFNWSGGGFRTEAALAVLAVFLLASIGAGAYFIRKMSGLRWFATSVFLLQIWLLHGAAFIAGMAISGDWL